MRNAFVDTLCDLAADDKKIFLLTGDLGFGVLNKFFENNPDNFICSRNGKLFLRLFKNANDFAAWRGVCDLGWLRDGINRDSGSFFVERSYDVTNDFGNCTDNHWNDFAKFKRLIGVIFMEIKAVGSQNYQSYNAPKKIEPPPAEEKSADTTTLSTDEVDSEIEDLKLQRAKLKNSLKISGDEDLQKQLTQIENELRLKDNDEYRKAHAKIIGGVDFTI